MNKTRRTPLTCSLGVETRNNFDPDRVASWDLCPCDQSCEPHNHNDAGHIECLHDGETDHGHCPNSPWGGR